MKHVTSGLHIALKVQFSSDKAQFKCSTATVTSGHHTGEGNSAQKYLAKWKKFVLFALQKKIPTTSQHIKKVNIKKPDKITH